MRLKLEFGLPIKRIKELEWFADISLMYKLIRLEGNLWVWLGYNKDSSGKYDFILSYGDTGPGEFWDESLVTDFEATIETRMFANKCECGSLYERGFENVHSYWCPKWEKI